MWGAQSVCLLVLCASIGLVHGPFMDKIRNKLSRKTTKTRNVVVAGNQVAHAGDTAVALDDHALGFPARTVYEKAGDQVHMNTRFYKMLTREMPEEDVECMKTPVNDLLAIILSGKNPTTDTDGRVLFEKSKSEMKSHYGLS